MVRIDNFYPPVGEALQSTIFCRLMDSGRLATITTVNRNTTPKMRKTRCESRGNPIALVTSDREAENTPPENSGAAVLLTNKNLHWNSSLHPHFRTLSNVPNMFS